jgi:hypothetical protein
MHIKAKVYVEFNTPQYHHCGKHNKREKPDKATGEFIIFGKYGR